MSSDGGATFQERHFGIYDQDWVTHVELSGKHVYVTTRDGLLVSHDRFRTYGRVSSGEFSRVTACGDDVYASRRGGVDVSHDAGATWSTVTTAPGATVSRDAACAGTNVYVATDAGLAISTDRGDHFTAARTTADGLDTNDVARVVAAGATIYVGTSGSSSGGKSFAVSTDGGRTFVAHLLGVAGYNVTPAAILVEGGTILVGTYPSLWRSTDGGVTFSPADLTGGFERVAGSGTDLYAVVGEGSVSGIAISHDRGRSWPAFRDAHVLAGTSPFGTVWPENVFLDGSKLYVSTGFGLAISPDRGATFELRTGSNDWTHQPNGNSNLSGNGSQCVAASGSVVWNGRSADVQKSTDGGQSFGAPIAMSYPQAIAFSGQDVYVADYGGLRVSNNGGTSFSLKAGAAGIAYPSTVRDVAIGPDGRVWVADEQQVDVSADHGATFTPIAATADSWPSALLVTPYALYVGTSSGIGISTDGGATFTWRDVYQGVSLVNDIHFAP